MCEGLHCSACSVRNKQTNKHVIYCPLVKQIYMRAHVTRMVHAHPRTTTMYDTHSEYTQRMQQPIRIDNTENT